MCGRGFVDVKKICGFVPLKKRDKLLCGCVPLKKRDKLLEKLVEKIDVWMCGFADWR